jgi:hypothetical protein
MNYVIWISIRTDQNERIDKLLFDVMQSYSDIQNFRTDMKWASAQSSSYTDSHRGSVLFALLCFDHG